MWYNVHIVTDFGYNAKRHGVKMLVLYIFVGSLVAFAYGIRIAWSEKDKGASDSEAICEGGFFGLLLGAFWPLALMGHLIGWMGLKAREKWLEDQELK